MSLNKLILIGNVGKDPVVKYFDKGVAKATFPMATSESYTNQQGENVTQTEWHNIVLWRSLAEIAEKTVKKGMQVYVAGKIKTRSYVDKDGVNKYITEILADALFTFEKKQTGPYQQAQQNGGQSIVSDTGAPYPKSSGTPSDIRNEPAEEIGMAGSDDDLPF